MYIYMYKCIYMNTHVIINKPTRTRYLRKRVYIVCIYIYIYIGRVSFILADEAYNMQNQNGTPFGSESIGILCIKS